MCALATLFSAPSFAQEGGGPAGVRADAFATPTATVARDSAGRVTVRATRITDPITIDGTLGEGVYGRIQAIDGFLQQEPHEGQPASQKTDVWLLYDEKNIYVAARCWTTDPARIVANEMRRDSFAIFQNDNFGVLFDTFHDRRNGFMFYTNPLGGLSDSLVTDERDTNRDWNTVWDVRAQRFDQGWTLEMAIPFRSLRYPAPGPQEWGVQFRRIARGANEFSYLTPMPAAFTQRAMTRVSQAATLVGLEAPKAALNLELKPYALGAVATDLNSSVPFRNDPSADVGFDTKYTFKNGLVADATVHTDFAQVEDDEQQVNLTRFSLFFPERREFFLEGAGIFAFGGASVIPRGSGVGPPSNTPILFYSRKIGLYQGDGVPCEPNPCEPAEACCFPSGGCGDFIPSRCAAEGGISQGPGSTCAQANCPQPPTGACCYAGPCVEITAAACAIRGGVYLGDGTECGPPFNPCPPLAVESKSWGGIKGLYR